MQRTKIEWADFSSNPIRAVNPENGKRGWACTKVSAGCARCYAERLNLGRFGNGLPFTVEGAAKARWELNRDELLRWICRRKPGRVFVGDMTDLYHERVSDEWLDQIHAAMALSPHLTFMELTKRPERMAEHTASPETPFRVARQMDVISAFDREPVNDEPACHRDGNATNKHIANLRWGSPSENGEDRNRHGNAPSCSEQHNVQPSIEWPLPNCWKGTSVENQEMADERVPHLLRCPAAVNFLSLEPLLGPIDLSPWIWPNSCGCLDIDNDVNPILCPHCRGTGAVTAFDWVIIGSESGSKARRCELDWVRGLRDQCLTAGVPFFWKQHVVNGRKMSTPELDGKRWVEFP